jgi:glycerophosphoryl diester phosphodiesterase
MVLLGAGGVAATLAGGAGLWARAARREWSPLVGTHAHNDYRQRRPLQDALRYGYVSVEADVWAVDGQLLVGHDAHDLTPTRTLRSLYLEPLAARVALRQCVHPGLTSPFQLVVEFKTDGEETYPLLEAELADYAGLLTRYENGQIVPGAISVVISGSCPRQVLAAQPLRYAGCDGSFAELGEKFPADLVPLISEKLAWRFNWRGVGPMPDEERAKLRKLVGQAHEEGRRVRFWGVPSKPTRVRQAIWRELHAAGVDYLDADRLRSLNSFLRRNGQPPTPS